MYQKKTTIANGTDGWWCKDVQRAAVGQGRTEDPDSSVQEDDPVSEVLTDYSDHNDHWDDLGVTKSFDRHAIK